MSTILIDITNATGVSVYIIDGEDCSIELHPYIVSIKTSIEMNHFCGGSLAQVDWVLTAAHCLEHFLKRPELITVAAGNSRVDLHPAQYSLARSVFIHKKFVSETLSNDIGMIKLSRGFQLSYTVQLVMLPKEESKTDIERVCRHCTILGNYPVKAPGCFF